MKNLAHKLHVINEKRGKLDLKQYVITSASADPEFLCWLFDKEPSGKSDLLLTEQQKKDLDTILAYL
jgi:hypothetical protein